MKTDYYHALGGKCYARGLMFYALFTLPALIFPPMYLISICLALLSSVIPAAIFVLCLPLLPTDNTSIAQMQFRTLVFGLVITFISTVIATVFITEGEAMIEAYLEFFLFPLAALLSAGLSIWSYRHQLVYK